VAGWIAVAIFIGASAFVVFAVVRRVWRTLRGEPEIEAGGSRGRQLFGRRRRLKT